MSAAPSRRPSLAALWYDGRVRLAVSQAAIVTAIVGAVWLLATRAVDRLEAIGVKSGFGFLAHRAGFSIGESVPMPVAGGGLALLAAAVLVGLVAGIGLSRWASARNRPVLGEPGLAAGLIAVVAGPPLLAVALVHGDIQVIRYTADNSLGTALVAGALNTVSVAAIALVLSTLVGLLVALMRLSGNWLIAAIGGAYVELIRNLPLLLHLFFWYFAVLRTLPPPRGSHSLFGWVFVNNRGVMLPLVHAGDGLVAVLLALAAGIALAIVWVAHRRRVKATTGAELPLAWPVAALAVLPAAIAWAAFGDPLVLTRPVLQGLNFRNATAVTPEFATLVVGLTLYHGAYNAEVIRAGVLAVPRGQLEAAGALGLRTRTTFRFIVMPQALRIIVPPLISRYLGLVKSSSLGVAIGFPEIVSIGHSVTYITGQALEVISLTMAFYLALSLTISLGLNWYNARTRIIGIG
jgi:general L-amino acid transport system permease protein